MNVKGKEYPEDRCFKVTRLYIKKFRKIENQVVDIGPNITLIAGQNGTSKSTLLGLIAHPFSTKNDDQSVYVRHYGDELKCIRTVNGKKFESDYRQMFRMEKEFDSPGNHEYNICLTGPDLINARGLRDEGIPVRSKPRSSTNSGVRLVSGKSHNAGEGNFPHPIVYLGLGRLAPLAECKKMSVEKSEEVLTDEEARWLHKRNAEILSITDSPTGIDILNSGLPGKGSFPASSYEDYNPATYSAGQDNLGQILIAVLSFRRLKEKLGDKYAGGILFVDELDAALFPSAQTRLLSVLAEESLLLGVQIIATTHSVTMMHYVFHSEIKQYANIVFLRKMNEKVVVEKDLTYSRIKSNLLIEYNPGERPALFFEDQLAIDFFNTITNGLFRDSYDLVIVGSAGVLENIASNRALQKRLSGVIVLDADRATESKLRNLIYLPGKKMPLETELYFFLKELSDEDLFWNHEKGFTKQYLYKYHNYEENENVGDKIKKWFNEQNAFEWGERGYRALKRWIDGNALLCREFCEKLINCIRATVPYAPELDEVSSKLKIMYSEQANEKNMVDNVTEGLELFEYADASKTCFPET